MYRTNQSVFSNVRRTELPKRDQLFFIQHFNQHEVIKADENWDWATILKATNISDLLFRRQLRTLIEQKAAQHPEQALGENSVVYVTGEIPSKRRELTQRIRALGAKRLWKYKAEVTHVVIGMRSPDYKLLADKPFIPTTDIAIFQQYENEQPRFLKAETGGETGQQMKENLTALLTSNDVASVKVAVEMIEQGGLPAGLFEPLLFVHKTTPDPSIKKLTKPLLEIHTPPAWKAVVLDNLSFVLKDRASFTNTLVKKFRKLTNRIGVTASVNFACLLYQYGGKGLHYVLLSKLPGEAKLPAYQLLYKDYHLDFAAGLAYKGRYSYPRSRIDLPVHALTLGEIRSINLSNCGYKSVGGSVLEFKDLRMLNLSNNRMEVFPTTVLRLPLLEKLDLSNNPLKTFPLLMFEEVNPAVKEIDLRSTPIRSVPERLQKALPNCQFVL